MKRGDVVWHKFDLPDKKRPVLILTRDGAISGLNAVTVVPITSTIRDLESEVLLTKWDGMENDCVANLDWIQTVPKSQLFGHVTHVSSEILDQVFGAIKYAFGFEEN